jgi:putative membrane protein
MRNALATLALLLVIACSPETAQQAHPRRMGAASPAPVLAPQDRDFLERAAEGSNAEIATGSTATRQAFRPEVKAFGQMMMKDHGAMNARLAAIAKRYNIALPTSLGEHQASYDRIVDLRYDRFDEEFMQVMVEDHDMALELFRGAASGAHDPALRAFAAAHVPVIEAHLNHAKMLAGPKPAPAQ